MGIVGNVINSSCPEEKGIQHRPEIFTCSALILKSSTDKKEMGLGLVKEFETKNPR